MTARLRGGEDLRKRLRAIGTAFKPIGQKWTKETVKAGRPMVPVRTGRLRKSFVRGTASMKRATVKGHFTAYFVDKGPKPHVIRPKGAKGLVFEGRGGRTVFARQVHHRGYRGRPFRKRMAVEGLRNTDMVDELIKLWNDAA